MPRVPRPGGIELHWEERGDGPAVLIAMHWAGHPRQFEPLGEELAGDHRVLIYHPRGTGESTRAGPYDAETDAADLEAVLTAAGAEQAVAIAIADGANRAIQAAARRPDLIRAVVIANANPIGRSAMARGDEALAGSRTVLDAMLSLIETSYRAGIRPLVASTNPDLVDEAEVQRRVDEVAEFCEPEAAAGRLRAWVESPAEAEARALGDRLWWLTTDRNPWFPAHLEERLPEVLPGAHVEAVADGPLNRPELAAAVVRRITGAPG